MKNLNRLFLALLLVSVTSCARTCESVNRNMQITDKQVKVQQYSGGKLINEWSFKGMVNSSQGSDGYYFTYQDSLIEVAGDIVIRVEN